MTNFTLNGRIQYQNNILIIKYQQYITTINVCLITYFLVKTKIIYVHLNMFNLIGMNIV